MSSAAREGPQELTRLARRELVLALCVLAPVLAVNVLPLCRGCGGYWGRESPSAERIDGRARNGTISPVRLESVPGRYLDIGIDCLATGRCSPPLAELSAAEIDCVASLLGMLVYTYERASWEAFVEFRRADIDPAGADRAADIVQLTHLAAQLTASGDEPCGGLLECLRACWTALYEEPPVARFYPETTVALVHTQRIEQGNLEAWQHSFDELRASIPGNAIQHRVFFPHRRSIETIAHESETVSWIDLSIEFATRLGNRCVLLSRFVWDGEGESWFLERAVTVYDEFHDPQSERGLLIL